MINQAATIAANVRTGSDALHSGFIALRSHGSGRQLLAHSNLTRPLTESRAFPRVLGRQSKAAGSCVRGLSCRAASTDRSSPSAGGTTRSGNHHSLSDSAGTMKSIGLADSILQTAESVINSWLTNPPGKYFMSGNFAPTEEKGPISDLKVEGVLPACLNGEFVRNGPNPQFPPKFGYHWFEGDGMLHGVRFADGRASYVCKYVRTSRFNQEGERGGPVFLKFGDAVGLPGIAKAMVDGVRGVLSLEDRAQGDGTANTNVVFHAGRLLALHEGDAPYLVRLLADGDFETVGRWTYEGSLGHNMTAHPKLDPSTGELFMFGYDVTKAGITYRVVSKDGRAGPPVPIPLPLPIMMHDFAITERYALFMDLPLALDTASLATKGTLPIVFDGSKESRFGILPRYATSADAMRWFTVPTCFIFHNANAWEEEDEVVLVACRYDSMDLFDFMNPPTKFGAYLTEFRFNLKTGQSSQRQLSPVACEFPRINDSAVGRKNRFIYASTIAFPFHFGGIAKFDLSTLPGTNGATNNSTETVTGDGCMVGHFKHSEGRFGSEPVFVPRPREEGKPAEEDDGYLLNFVYDSKTEKSEVVVVDAKTMSQVPVGCVKLPFRVPYGFHGVFVSEVELNAQHD